MTQIQMSRRTCDERKREKKRMRHLGSARGNVSSFFFFLVESLSSSLPCLIKLQYWRWRSGDSARCIKHPHGGGALFCRSRPPEPVRADWSLRSLRLWPGKTNINTSRTKHGKKKKKKARTHMTKKVTDSLFPCMSCCNAGWTGGYCNSGRPT